MRAASEGDGNLLNLLPDYAYRAPLAWLGYSRRSILIVNDPPEVARVLANADGLFPKSDLMVGALEPLVGESMFVSEGKTWSRQRKMIDPAFSHMRLTAAFEAMSTAVDAYERRLNEAAQTRTPVSLDLAMSHLTADIICRTVFTTSLESHVAREVFEDFAIFERSVAEVEIRRLIVDPAWTRVPQKADVLEACQRIRAHLGDLLAPHLSADGETASDAYDDIATALVKARAAGDGRPFTRKELLDQLGVFFLAGHETTASVLTWVFFIVATQPTIAERMREEIHG
ncbi:MAG: cytochrome P450, partial [Pseudomonadota bacterium]